MYAEFQTWALDCTLFKCGSCCPCCLSLRPQTQMPALRPVPSPKPLSGTCLDLTPRSLHPAQRSRPLPSWDRVSHESRRTRGSAGVSLGLLQRQSRRQCCHLHWPCPVQQGRAVPCPDALRPAPLARPAGKGSSSRKKQHGLFSQRCLGCCCTFPLYIMDSFCMRERKE